MKTKKNFAVLIYEKDYPKKGGIATLVGIYPTNGEAAFISKIVKERNRLQFFPTIEPTEFEPTTTLVGDYLRRMNEAREEALKAKSQQDRNS